MQTRPLAMLAALLLAAPALAQAGDADVRCIMASNVFSKAEKDGPKKQLALATGLFFAGRADARLSPAQLKAQVQAQGKALTTENVAEAMTVCARTFQAKQRGLVTIGQQIAASQPRPAAGPAKPAAKK